MPVTKVVDIIRRVEELLQDEGADGWSLISLQDWINDAYKEIVKYHPEANTLVASVTLRAGVRQNLLDADSINLTSAISLIEVTRNVHASSLLRPITKVDREAMDIMIPGWRTATASANIHHWMADKDNPVEFDVYPQPVVYTPAAAQVEIKYSAVPALHALEDYQLDPNDSDNDDLISIDDIYTTDIVDFVIYRAWLKESDSPNAAVFAANHYNAFRVSMGLDAMKMYKTSRQYQPQNNGGQQ